jgi:hypothetical protein
MRRFLAGLLVAPLVATAVAVAGVVAAASLPALDPYLPPIVFPDDLPFLGAWALLFAAGVTAFGVIPLALWQRPRPPARLRTHLIVGALLGISPFLLLGVLAASFAAFDADWRRIGHSTTTLAPFALIGAIAGAVAASVYFVTTAPAPAANGSAA